MKDQPVNNVPPVQPPVEPAPVQQWQQTPPAQAQVQYVVAQKSLDGIGGWLLFWLIVFSLGGIGNVWAFFMTISNGINTPVDTMSVIFSPLIAGGYLASVVLIAMRKKLGIYVSMASLGVVALSNVVNTVITASNGSSGETVATSIGSVIVSLLFTGLMILYFYTSKRVKATLVN